MRIVTFLLTLLIPASYGVAEIYHGVAVPPGGMSAWVVSIETTAVYHTTDFGVTWKSQEISTFRDFFDTFFLNDSQGWTCGRVGDIWYTSDAGANWGRQNLGGPKFATRIRFLDSRYGWSAGGEAILLHTTNGGTDWQMTFFPRPPYPSDTVDFQGLSFVDRNTGWLVAGRFPEGGDTFAFGQGFITKTEDACSTWTLQRTDTVYDFYDVAFIDANNGWVVGGNDRTMNGVVLHTTDGGNSWTEQTVPAGTRFLRTVAFKGNKGWACGRNGTVIHTSDQGATWVKQTTGVDTTLFDIEFADTLRGMAVGNSVVLVTTNGGATWIRRMGGVEEDTRRRVQVSSLRVEPSVVSDGVAVLKLPASLDCGNDRAVVQVFDALGRQVLSRAYCAQRTACGVPLELSSLPPGVYMARLDGVGAATFVCTDR